MRRAVVLGGGGPLGVGWEAGFLAGLADAGVVLEDADLVIGTSAGSIVGAQLTSGRPWSTWSRRSRRRRRGRQTAPGPSRRTWARCWPLAPARPRCPRRTGWRTSTTSAGSTGRRASAAPPSTSRPVSSPWDRASGVELPRAVASSCTVPGLAPPVTIADGHYIDGGARDVLNADLAVGHDVVVALSCMALEPPDGAVPELLAGLLPAVRQRIDELRTSGSLVEVVEPSEAFLEMSGWGRWLMAVSRTGDAFASGRHQGEAAAPRIGRLWSTGS